MNRGHFLRSMFVTLAGSVICSVSAGCVAPRMSPAVSQQKHTPGAAVIAATLQDHIRISRTRDVPGANAKDS